MAHIGPKVKILTAAFNLGIRQGEISKWRGAFVEMAGREFDLFHNHISKDKFHYRYPLIHYRVWKRQASIYAINEGIDEFQGIMAKSDWKLKWKNQLYRLKIEELNVKEHTLSLNNAMHKYRINKWLPLSQENYGQFQKCQNLTERAAHIERILTGQILGFCTAMDWKLPDRLIVNLQEIHHKQGVNRHNTRMLAFDVTYQTNLSLPQGTALGRGISKGFGWHQMG